MSLADGGRIFCTSHPIAQFRYIITNLHHLLAYEILYVFWCTFLNFEFISHCIIDTGMYLECKRIKQWKIIQHKNKKASICPSPHPLCKRQPLRWVWHSPSLSLLHAHIYGRWCRYILSYINWVRLYYLYCLLLTSLRILSRSFQLLHSIS